MCAILSTIIFSSPYFRSTAVFAYTHVFIPSVFSLFLSRAGNVGRNGTLRRKRISSGATTPLTRRFTTPLIVCLMPTRFNAYARSNRYRCRPKQNSPHPESSSGLLLHTGFCLRSGINKQYIALISCKTAQFAAAARLYFPFLLPCPCARHSHVKIAPSSDGGGASSGEGAAADSKSTGGSSSVAGTAAPGSGRAGGFGRALAVASAPVYYLFGLLGDVPGWFSDVVFEVGKVLIWLKVLRSKYSTYV